jgi:Ca-activated chloride channel homolog
MEKVTVVADTKTLQEIARITGGRYAAAPTAERLKQVYRDLGSRIGKRRQEREVTAGFAGAGVVLLLAACGLSLAWTRRPL